MNLSLIIAAVIALITWAIHTFVGTRQIAGPLLAAEMRPEPKYTNFYCWHLVTIVLLAMSGSFAYAAWVPAGRDVAIVATILSLSFMLWSAILIAWKYPKPMRLPQWILFGAISVAGVLGVL